MYVRILESQRIIRPKLEKSRGQDIRCALRSAGTNKETKFRPLKHDLRFFTCLNKLISFIRRRFLVTNPTITYEKPTLMLIIFFLSVQLVKLYGQEALPQKIQSLLWHLPEGISVEKAYSHWIKTTYTLGERGYCFSAYLTCRQLIRKIFPLPVECNIICWTYLMEMVFCSNKKIVRLGKGRGKGILGLPAFGKAGILFKIQGLYCLDEKFWRRIILHRIDQCAVDGAGGSFLT